MEVEDELRITNTGDSGIALKGSSVIALTFFALQFLVLAIDPGESGPGLSSAWNLLVASAVVATGVVIAGRLVAGNRFAPRGLDGVGAVAVRAGYNAVPMTHLLWMQFAT